MRLAPRELGIFISKSISDNPAHTGQDRVGPTKTMTFFFIILVLEGGSDVT